MPSRPGSPQPTATLRPTRDSRPTQAIAAALVLLAALTALPLTLLPTPAALARRASAPASASSSAPSPPTRLGPNAHSTLIIQNVGTESGTFHAAVTRHASTAPPIVRIANLILPGGAFRDALPSADGLPPADYAARITADRPTAAVARLSWGDGRRVMYRDVEASMDVILPLLAVQYYGQTSRVAIQNTAPDHTTRVTMTLWPKGGTAPASEKQYDIPAGSAIVLELGRDWSAPPFVGSARIVSHNAPIAVTSVVEIEGSVKAAYAVVGVPAERAARTLFAPLVRKEYVDLDRRVRSTGISIVNPSAEPVQVRATYRGVSPACRDLTIAEGPVRLPGHGTTAFYQPANADIPTNCEGAAVLEADGPILAVVNDAYNFTVESAAYPALGADEAATAVALPELSNGYGPDVLYSSVTMMNVSAVTATVEFKYQAEDATAEIPCGHGCRATVPPHESVSILVHLNSIPGARGTRGSGLVTSDQPVVVVVSETSYAGTVDAASYVGIPVGAPQPGGPIIVAPQERYVPWLAAGERGVMRSHVYLPIGWR